MKKKAAKKASAGRKPAKKTSAASKKPAKKASAASKKPAKKAQASAGRGTTQAPRSPAQDVNALWQAKWPEIVASAWADTPPGFRQRLLTDTQNVLKEYGLPMVEGLHYRVAEGSERFEVVLPLPSAPALQESTMRGGPGVPTPSGARTLQVTEVTEVPRCGGGDGGGGEFTI